MTAARRASFRPRGRRLYFSTLSHHHDQFPGAHMTDESSKLSRREFTALSLAAGMTVAARASAAALEVVDTDVEVKTADGTTEAALIHPKGKGQWPGVILFVDVFGLRPTMRDMAKRLAANGYTVLVPNPYYRTTKAPGLPSTLDFTNKDDLAKISALRKPRNRRAPSISQTKPTSRKSRQSPSRSPTRR